MVFGNGLEFHVFVVHSCRHMRDCMIAENQYCNDSSNDELSSVYQQLIHDLQEEHNMC